MSLAEIDALLTKADQEMTRLRLRNAELESALYLIAAPKRADGTYNHCREACEQLAREALKPLKPL